MHFPSYWARGGASDGRNRAEASGWSDESRAGALAMARERAANIVRGLSAHNRLARYEYGVRDPLREEVIERSGTDGAGDAIVVTREGV